ncbi:hypothetical protein TL16_g08902 [Triparma laevis f. inornata]|uniref:Sm domain-containing protein n=2 Tax=Triparma laevis TaxID=1534972 RepID=A0A9W7KXR2_9STRA|nr:hypothetical protein TL16_g08902 [Triparma laevis f. inornata]GMI15304.1 hypothetical protein TrLO_g10496 [Triparma laevis f. longispina]
MPSSPPSPSPKVAKLFKISKQNQTIPSLLRHLSSPITLETKPGTIYTGTLLSTSSNFNVTLQTDKEIVHIRGTLIRYISTSSNVIKQINLGIEREKVEQSRRKRNTFKRQKS